MSYAEKLKDPRWQRRRLEILQRDDWKCIYCSDLKAVLHVHHKKYAGLNPWDAPDDYLITLCEHCHVCEELKKKTDWPVEIKKGKKYRNSYDDQVWMAHVLTDGNFVLSIFYGNKFKGSLVLYKQELQELISMINE